MSGTSWLMGGGYAWRSARLSVSPGEGIAVVADPELGLSLPPLTGGSLGLESPDGSLGRLTLPLGVAVALDTVLLLAADGSRVFVYDAAERRLRALSNVGADGSEADESASTEPRRFTSATNIAAFGRLLYVADPEAARVQVFDWTTGALVRIHAGLVNPVDVAAGERGVYVLEANRGRVHFASPHRAGLTLVADIGNRSGRWTRIAIDKSDSLYLRDIEPSLLDGVKGRAVLDVVVPSRRRPARCAVERVHDGGSVRSRFASPTVWSVSAPVSSTMSLRDCDAKPARHQRFALHESLSDPCNVQIPAHDASAPSPPAHAKAQARLSRDGSVFIANSKQVAPLRREYTRSGTWISDWLDSAIYQCQWHLVELNFSELPPGSRIVVRTRTTNERPADNTLPTAHAVASAGSWSPPLAIDAPAQPTMDQLTRAKRQDLLVQSGPGQYLQLQLELEGDGIATPQIARVRLRFPYESLREYLPALYSAPEEQRLFVDRYLGIVQRTWDDIEQTVTRFEQYLDADTVPAGVPMEYLASWMGVRLEGTWTAQQNRRLFGATRDSLPSWGTPAALRQWIAAYLENMSGFSAAEIERTGMPAIVEGFVERRRLMLGRGETARLGSGEPLWSPNIERRLQIGVFDREGEVELVSVGDPDMDFFRHSAHRFRVYVPAAWVRTEAEEALLRRAIAAQTPAHASYELVMVAPRFRIGVQSTVALDTVIGASANSGLACPSGDRPPSAPPHTRLGFDLVLGAGNSAAILGSTDLILA